MTMYKLSQTCQIPNLNQIYIEYFGKFTNNRLFVEIGAYDGESVSNTSCLADAGWKGIYVEPIHSNYVKCLERHKNNNVIVSNLAIGIEEGVQKIYSNDILSSLDEEHAHLGVNKFHYPKFKEEICYQIRMDTFLNNYNVNENFDLLVVDVEGREDQVFYSFDLKKWKPKMLIIELVDDHEYFLENENIIQRVKKLRTFIHNTGYREIYRDDINTIFISNDFI
jgi:FkbM family methyltransferase